MKAISNALNITRFTVLFAAMILVSTNELLAQDRKSIKREAEPVQKAQVQTATLQAVTAEDQLRTAIQRCGAPCKMDPSGTIAGPGGGTLDYNCNDDGDCSCFGAKDCVAMSDVCKEGTMGCNKQGCVCEEDSGG